MDENYDVRDSNISEAEKEYEKKLRPHELIKTVRGSGYVFIGKPT